MRRAREQHPELPRTVFVHQGDVAQGERLLRLLWPEAPAVSDPELRLYRGFSVQRGRLRELLGPRTWRAGFRALRKGHFVGRPVGDPLVLPGMFLAHRDRILWQHRFRHVGDLPSTEVLLGVAARAGLSPSGAS